MASAKETPARPVKELAQSHVVKRQRNGASAAAEI